MKRPVIHCMQLETDAFEPVLDDNYYQLTAHIENGDFNSRKENEVVLRVNTSGAAPEALVWGGLVILSNLRREAVYRALMAGMQILILQGDITDKDFYE